MFDLRIKRKKKERNSNEMDFVLIDTLTVLPKGKMQQIYVHQKLFSIG